MINSKTKSSKGPIRVLQVVGGMDRCGGVQAGLMHLLRYADSSIVKMDFLVDIDKPYDFASEIESLGGKVIPCTNPRNPFAYKRNFAEVLKKHGPYDVVHTHVGYRNGFILRLAHQAGIPARIVHSHAAFDNSDIGLLRKAYIGLQMRWIDRYMTGGVAVSSKAAEAMFGKNCSSDPRCKVQGWCVIDTSTYPKRKNATDLRKELGIASDALVVGHVGRLEIEKNHPLILNIACEAKKIEPRVKFVLVGTGSLFKSLEKNISEMNLSDTVIMAGSRNDVPELMTGVFDAFFLPSLYEGMPVVMIEAQAAGLPCIISDVIAEESDVVPGLVNRLSLETPASEWANVILKRLSSRANGNEEMLAIISKSDYNVTQSVNNLVELYSAHTSNCVRTN